VKVEAALLATYLLVSCYFCINWLKFRRRVAATSVEDAFLSVVVLLIVTTLWPLTIPISIWQLLKATNTTSNATTAFLAMLVLMLIFGVTALNPTTLQTLSDLVHKNHL